jgi:negative regulator of sigma E activity
MADTNPRDRDPNAPEARDRPAASVGGWLPLVVATAVCLAVIAMVHPRVTTDRAGDTNNAGPVQTVAPMPSPSTSPAVPTPNPAMEPRRTQAPQP